MQLYLHILSQNVSPFKIQRNCAPPAARHPPLARIYKCVNLPSWLIQELIDDRCEQKDVLSLLKVADPCAWATLAYLNRTFDGGTKSQLNPNQCLVGECLIKLSVFICDTEFIAALKQTLFSSIQLLCTTEICLKFSNMVHKSRPFVSGNHYGTNGFCSQEFHPKRAIREMSNSSFV